MSTGNPDAVHARVRVAGRALCALPDEKPTLLFVTGLAAGGATLLSMRPPALGSLVSMVIHPIGLPALPSLEGRVIGLRVDPEHAERSGFEVVFLHVDEDALSRLQAVVAATRVAMPAVGRADAGTEHREDPRVSLDLHAVIALPDGQVTGRLSNIGMGGAFLVTGDRPLPDSVRPGTSFKLEFPDVGRGGTFLLKAKVARVAEPGEPRGFGIRWVHVHRTEERKLEALIVQFLVGAPLAPESL